MRAMFSSNHRQHLLVAFKHLDESMGDVLRKLGVAPDAPLFGSLRNDVDPAALARAQLAVAGVRAELRTFMASHNMRPTSPDSGAAHAAHALLGLAAVSATELEPDYLLGYGALSEQESAELARLSERLRARLDEVVKALPERRS